MKITNIHKRTLVSSLVVFGLSTNLMATEEPLTDKERFMPAIPAQFISTPSTTMPDKKTQQELVKVIKKTPVTPTSYEASENTVAATTVQKNNPTLPQIISAQDAKLDFSKYTYQLEAGRNQVIPIAINFSNRIVTPFQEPRFVGANDENGKQLEGVSFIVRDNVIYVYTEEVYPIAGYIINGEDQSVALSVTLFPKKVPPREITLEFDEHSSSLVGVMGNKKANQWETQTSYYTVIRDVFRALALQQIPQSYVIGKTNVMDGASLPQCAQEGLSFEFIGGQTLTGHNLGVFVGVVKNTSNKVVEFKGEVCGGWGIKAATSWPHTYIKPGQLSEVYVAFSIDRTPQSSRSNKRKSLIN